MDIRELCAIVLALIAVIIGVLCIRYARNKPRLISLCGRVSGFLLTASGALLAVILLSSEACTNRLAPVASPDGRYSATVTTIDGGATEPFHTSVSVRSRWSILSHVVFASEDAPRTVQLNWVSSSHLLIRTRGDPANPQDPEYKCSRLPDVEISCHVDWPP